MQKEEQRQQQQGMDESSNTSSSTKSSTGRSTDLHPRIPDSLLQLSPSAALMLLQSLPLSCYKPPGFTQSLMARVLPLLPQLSAADLKLVFEGLASARCRLEDGTARLELVAAALVKVEGWSCAEVVDVIWGCVVAGVGVGQDGEEEQEGAEKELRTEAKEQEGQQSAQEGEAGGERISWRSRKKSMQEGAVKGQEIKWRSNPRKPSEKQEQVQQKTSPQAEEVDVIGSKSSQESAAAAAKDRLGQGIAGMSEKYFMAELIREMDNRLGKQGLLEKGCGLGPLSCMRHR